MKTVIEMARDAGFETMLRKGRICGFDRDGDYTEELEQFAELVRADERENGQKWFDAVTAQHKQAILAEREACAKVCENGVDTEHPTVKGHIMKDFGQSRLLATAIRARSKT